jgi:hypothetical protein
MAAFSSNKRSTRWLPINPPAPVTKTLALFKLILGRESSDCQKNGNWKITHGDLWRRIKPVFGGRILRLTRHAG